MRDNIDKCEVSPYVGSKEGFATVDLRDRWDNGIWYRFELPSETVVELKNELEKAIEWMSIRGCKMG